MIRDPILYDVVDIKKPLDALDLQISFSQAMEHWREMAEGDQRFIQFVMTLMHTLEERDTYTAGHCERTGIYAHTLAIALGLSTQIAKMLRIAGLFHDIGKIGIRDAVLLKNGKLTEEEFNTIKGHPTKGEGILVGLRGVKKMGLKMNAITQMVLRHHERLDGRGYPDGKGEGGLPFSSLILPVADVFDALTTTRPYREAMSLKDAFGIIEKGRETQFHPDVIDGLMDVVSQGIEIHEPPPVLLSPGEAGGED